MSRMISFDDFTPYPSNTNRKLSSFYIKSSKYKRRATMNQKVGIIIMSDLQQSSREDHVAESRDCGQKAIDVTQKYD